MFYQVQESIKLFHRHVEVAMKMFWILAKFNNYVKVFAPFISHSVHWIHPPLSPPGQIELLLLGQ